MTTLAPPDAGDADGPRRGHDRALGWLAGLSALALAWVIRDVIAPMLVGGLIAIVAYPAFTRLLRRLRGRRSAAAWLATVVVLVALLAPTALVVFLLIGQLADGLAWVSERVQHAGG